MVTVYESFENVHELSALHAAVDAGDWGGAARVLEAMPTDDAVYALSLLADREGAEVFLERAVDDDATQFARVALALRYVALGKLARSSAADESQQYAVFRSWLSRAEVLLIDACARRPDLAPAWSARVLTARFLQVGRSEADRRYEALRSLTSHNFPAQMDMLQYLLPKWFGTNDEAYTFVRRALAAAPPGAHTGALVPLFHIERWRELGGAWPGKQYMLQQVVLDDLRNAAAMSVLHPSHRPGPIGVQAHSAFAMAYFVAGMEDEAARHLQIVAGRGTEYPWDYTCENSGEFAALRRRLMNRVAGGAAR